uniref:Peptidase S9 prolyl oligopeptidase catalytic domain-containing protein n=1 Tax=Nannocystis exedens TaxID=54 RepID=A0A3S7V0T2_9BACT|nr:hypothetical protein [Nannocystis exedens]
MSSRPFTPEDIRDYKEVTDVQISPDGRALAYALKTIDGESYKSQLWLASLDDDAGAPRPLTSGEHRDTTPRWSHDGSRIAFQSSRSEGIQLFVIDPHGGEARQLTRMRDGVQKATWSPDGTKLLFAAAVAVERRPDDVSEAQWQDRPRVVTRADYKSDGIGYKLDERTHLYTVDLVGGEPRQLTEGDADDLSAAWSMDGRAIAFARSRTGPRDSHRTDLWRMDADGKHARRLTTELSSVSSPAWSPDGRTIAVYGQRCDGNARREVWLVDADSGAARPLDEHLEVASYPLDNQPPPFWIDEGRALVVLRAYEGVSELVRVSLQDRRITALADGRRQVTSVSAWSGGDRIAFMCDDYVRHCEISCVRVDGTDERLVTRPNEDWAKNRVGFEVTQRRFEGTKEGETWGWLMLPTSRGDGPVPLWVDIHGGPTSYVSLGFTYHPYWHVLVSRGWAVLALDALGSGSYGSGFAERLRGHWGERDLPQHLAAIDELVEAGLVDGRRIAIGGKSYGGYLAAWAIGQTRRFCAAVVSAPVANILSHFGTSDSGYYVTPYAMAGEVWDAREKYHALSPVEYLEHATTPTLILQGEDDQRCPIGQAEEVFATLVRAGKAPVEFIRYPGGDHHLAEKGSPSHRIDYTRRIAEWVERWAGRDSRRSR